MVGQKGLDVVDRAADALGRHAVLHGQFLYGYIFAAQPTEKDFQHSFLFRAFHESFLISSDSVGCAVSAFIIENEADRRVSQ